MVTALVATTYTYLTLKLVRAQSDPKVIVYVKHDFHRPSILMIVVENIGRDIAHDVKFVSSRPIPAHGWGIEKGDAVTAGAMKGPLVDGIPALGPNDSRQITWGQYGGLSQAIGPEPIRLEYTYTYQGRKYEGGTQLEVESYLGTDAAEPPALVAAKGIKEIEKGVDRIASSLRSIVEKYRVDNKPPYWRRWRKTREEGGGGSSNMTHS